MLISASSVSLSSPLSASVDLSGLGVTELRAVIGLEDATLDGTSLKLGGQTSVVLK